MRGLFAVCPGAAPACNALRFCPTPSVRTAPPAAVRLGGPTPPALGACLTNAGTARRPPACSGAVGG
eukprot:11249567-Alexandrium_andersonii.AAC.1